METIDKFDDKDLDYVAFQGGYSVRRIILHIAQEEYGEIQYGITREIGGFPSAFPEDAYPTKADAKALSATVHDKTSRYLHGLSNGRIGGEIEAGWGGTYPLIDMILHVIEHEIHNRGELSFILGLPGRLGLDA